MANEIVKQNGKILELTPDKIDLIRKTVAKDANTEELAMFLHMCKVYELDPFLKELVFIKRKVWNEFKNGYDEIPTMMLSRDGILAIAHRSGQFDGMETNALYDEKGNLTGAECTVWNKSFTHPIKAKVLFKEYAAYRKDGKLQALWGTKPTTMICKVAEAQALRKSFNIKGVYIHEEFDAEIENDGKTEIEHLGDRLAISEKLHGSKENYDEWAQEIKTKILDDIVACQNEQQLSHIKRQYEKDILNLLDEDRLFILDEFDRALERFVFESPEPEIQEDGKAIDRKTGQEVELEPEAEPAIPQSPKSPTSDPVADLKERETFGQAFLKQVVAEIKLCSTKAQLNVFKNKKASDRMKLLPEARDYFDALLKQAFEKTK